MKRTLIILAAIATIAVLVLTLILWPRHHDAQATRQHEFVIDEDFARVRKILVRTNAIKKVVAMANAELLDQSWLGVSFDWKRLLRDPEWNLNGQGTLTVRTNDPYIGQHEIELEQVVDVRVEQLHVANRLTRPVAKLQSYQTTMDAAPLDNRSQFRATMTLKVSSRVSPLFRHVADDRVSEAAQQALRQQELAIRKTVEDHKHDLIILPDLSQLEQ